MPSNLDFLYSIGTKRSSTTVTISSIESILYDWAGKAIEDAQNNLDKKANVASGKLSSSMKILPVEFAGSKYVLKVTLEDYYDFINKGVRGAIDSTNAPQSPYQFKNKYPSKKMALAILKWFRQGTNKSRDNRTKKNYSVWGLKNNLEKKNRRLYDSVKKADSLKSLAYATASNIKAYGIKTTHFLDNAVSKNYPLLKKQLEKALKDDIGIMVRQINIE